MPATHKPLRPLVFDGHADTVQRILHEGWNLTDPLGEGMLNLASARAGGLSAQMLAVWVEPTEHGGRLAHEALRQIDAIHNQVHRAQGAIQLCRNAADIRAAHQAARFGVVLSLEGGGAIEHDLALLRCFSRLGVRSMTLTWSHSVGWADSSGDAADPVVPHAHGLSAFGHQVVREMNRLGMMIDISHVSDETFWAVLSASKAPIIASHSSARALTAAPRNLTDEQLRALHERGGLAMVNFFPAFLDEAWRQAWNLQRPEREAAQQQAAKSYRAQGLPVLSLSPGALIAPLPRASDRLRSALCWITSSTCSR